MRTFKILALVLLAGATLLFFNLWLDSREDQKAYYPTAADTQRDKVGGADAFERGWLPTALKSGASEIREEHNVSTNQGRATFRYAPVFLDVLEQSCSRFSPEAPVSSPFSSPFRRWPGFLRKGDTAATLYSRNIRVFNCDGFTVAIDREQSGFFWH